MSVTKQHSITIFFLALLWIFFILIQYVSTYFSLFWYFWWLDIIMHVYGGVLIVSSWFMVKSLGAFESIVGKNDHRALLLLGITIVVWEIYEYTFGLITPVGYPVDTVMDLLVGFGGGLAAFFLFHSRTIETT